MQRWEKETGYYVVYFAFALLGACVVTRACVRIGSLLDRSRHILVPDGETGLLEIEKIANRMEKCGYRIVKPGCWVKNTGHETITPTT